MSGRHAREVRRIAQRLWPERYQTMPYLRALLMLHRSPRVYRTATTLIDPDRGVVWPALGPRLPGG
jgi:hypothetical protein